MSWELIWQTNLNSYLYICTHQAFGHEIQLGQNTPHQLLGVQVGRHVVAQAVWVLVTGVLCHNDRVDAGIEEPLNGRLSDSVVSQTWPADPHMVGSPLQHAPKRFLPIGLQANQMGLSAFFCRLTLRKNGELGSDILSGRRRVYSW